LKHWFEIGDKSLNRKSGFLAEMRKKKNKQNKQK